MSSIDNLNLIYSVKGELKTIIGTESDDFTYYGTYVTNAISTSYTNGYAAGYAAGYDIGYAAGQVAQTYDLILNQTSGGTISASKTTGFTSGDTVVVTATPDAGYALYDWNISLATDFVQNNNTVTLTFGESDVIVYANFVAIPQNYDVTVVTPTGGTVTASPSGTVSAGTQVTFTATPIHNGQTTSYNFDHWSITIGNTTSTETTNPVTVTATGDVTCQATFIRATIMQLHAWDADGTTQYLSATGTFNGDTYTMRTDSVNNDITEYWPTGTEVTVEYHGSDMMSWEYSNWDDSGQATTGTLSNPDTFTLSGRQMTCNGQYDHSMPPQMEFQVTTSTFPVNAALSVSGGGTYMEFDTCTLTASSSDPDYEFMEWVNDSTSQTLSMDNPYSFTVDQDYNIRANFMYNEPMMQYTVTTSTNQPGNPDVEVSGGGTYMEFDTCTLTASTVDYNYEFMQWVDTSTYQVVSMDNPYSFTVDNDYSIRADFRYNEPFPEMPE